MSKVSRKYYTDKQEYTIQNNGAMDIGDSPRETVLILSRKGLRVY